MVDKTMLLAIDVGNTNTVFAVFKNREMIHSWRCQSEASRSVDEYAVFLDQLFDMVNLEWAMISSVIVSSVVPDANFHLGLLFPKYVSCKPIFIDYETSGIHVDLDNPEDIGADRLVCAAAIIADHMAPAIIIDFGTATTFEVIDKDNIYRGGIIAPGIRLSAEALTSRAAQLPQVLIGKPKAVVGKNTRHAMQSGMYWGYIGLIETIVKQIKNEIDTETITVIATGGLAPLYAQDSQCIDRVDENLIFKGLLAIHDSIKDTK